MRILHTALYTDKAFLLLRMFKYNLDNVRYCGERSYKKLNYAELKRAVDGEVIFEIDDGQKYYYSWKRTIWAKVGVENDAKIRDELAWLLKCMVRQIIANAVDPSVVNSEWRRDSKLDISDKFVHTATCSWSENDKKEFHEKLKGLTVGDAYCVYELLRDRGKIKEKYDEKMVNGWRGAQFDPARVELENAKREELEKYAREEKTERDAASTLCQKKIDQFTLECRKERDHQLQLITEKFLAKRRALQDRINTAIAMAFA